MHFTNLIRDKIGKKYLPFIQSKQITIDEKNTLIVKCLKSNKPVFLKINDTEEFYIRAGPSSTQIKGSELIEYIENKFKKN